MKIRFRGRWYRLAIEKHRTVGGYLRVNLVLSWWGKGPHGISQVYFPLYPLGKPFKL